MWLPIARPLCPAASDTCWWRHEASAPCRENPASLGAAALLLYGGNKLPTCSCLSCLPRPQPGWTIPPLPCPWHGGHISALSRTSVCWVCMLRKASQGSAFALQEDAQQGLFASCASAPTPLLLFVAVGEALVNGSESVSSFQDALDCPSGEKVVILCPLETKSLE